MSIIVSGSGSS